MYIELLNAMPHGAEFLSALRNGKFEINDDNGLFFPAQKAIIHGLNIWHRANDGLGWIKDHNLVPTEGRNHILDVTVHDGTKISTWYVGAFSGNVAPDANWTAATFASTATELTTQISEATRPTYIEAAPSGGSTSNTASAATITAATGQSNVTVWGAGILSSSTKGGTSGILLSAEKFTAARTLVAEGDTLDIRITLNLTSS